MKTPYRAKLIRHPLTRRVMMLLTVEGATAILEVAAGLRRIAMIEKGGAA